ncbi:hypothetical protein [Aquamicrobium zhengzhouense]|uniref:Uncharacterized protein n=1 Tax=Aquamicrobium zhengzhouense TaxID=2781738 RepID=A0ABS0SBW6_9HYPH|nr:hypothetical protein [Aquamicrobium zhengzhouense]MBI1620794.1 hypothetical protein [Aquamicrobium zhengzhouense]
MTAASLAAAAEGLPRLTDVQKINRAVGGIYELINRHGLPDASCDVLMDAVTRLEDELIEAPIVDPEDISEKFRFFADKIDRACGGVDYDERDCLGVFIQQLEAFRRAEARQHIGCDCPVWGAAA